MSFKSSQQQNIKKEFDKKPDTRVVKIDQAADPDVQEFQFPKIAKAGDGSYAATKARYGALAASDPDRTVRSRSDARFAINPLLRDPLSIEEEERRIIEEKVKVRVAELAEDARKTAEAQGYEAGLKKGHDEAFKKFHEEGQGRLERFDQLLDECERAKTQIFEANERFLIEMVFRIARMVALKELSADRDYVLRVARDLLERVGVRENISIRVSEADAGTINQLREGLEKSLGQLKNLNIEASNQVKLGGCMIETEWNAIDASIETQLQGIYRSLIDEKEPKPEGSA